MNRKKVFVGLMMGLLLVLLLTVTAGAAEDPLKFQMELSKQTFSGPETVWVSITVTNQSDSDLPGPMTLYDPDRKQVEDFGTPILSAGESRSWTGSWDVTEEQLATGKLTFGIRFFVDGEDGQPVEKVRYFSKRIRIDEAAPEVSDQPGGGAAENGGRPMLPKFLATAEKYFQNLSFAENDYEAVLSLPDQQVRVNVRQGSGITEIDAGDFGTVQIGEEVVLRSNGTAIVVDYASIFDYIQNLFSEKQMDQASVYLNRLYQRALTELILPFVETAVDADRLSFHLDLDSETFITRLAAFLGNTVGEEEFQSVYAVLGPILHSISPEIPETADALVEACSQIWDESGSSSLSWRVDTDVLVSFDDGEVREIAVSGYLDFEYAYSYRCPFSVDMVIGEADLLLKADIRLPFGSLNASVTGNQISAEIRGSSRYDTIRIAGTYDSPAGILDLQMQNAYSETVGTIRGQFLENLMDVTVQYMDQTISASLIKGEHFLHGKLSGIPAPWYGKERTYHVEAWFYEEPNQEYRVVVNGGTDGIYRDSWSAEAVGGPSRFSVKFTSDNPYYPLFSMSAQRKDQSRYDFRIEYTPSQRSYRNTTPYMLHLTGENQTWEIAFSYPYKSWKVEGEGNVHLNVNYEPVSVSGQAVATYDWHPTDYRDVSTLEYVPGRLSISAITGHYLLERTRDDENYVIWQLSLDDELLYQLEFNLTETDRGPGISGCLSTGEDIPIAELTVSPVEKQWILPLNREYAILVNGDTIPSLISMLLKITMMAE